MLYGDGGSEVHWPLGPNLWFLDQIFCFAFLAQVEHGACIDNRDSTVEIEECNEGLFEALDTFLLDRETLCKYVSTNTMRDIFDGAPSFSGTTELKNSDLYQCMRFSGV